MAIAIDPKQTHRFVLPSERALPETEQTVFLIHAPSVRAEREASIHAEAGKWFDYGMCVLRHNLVGWENFKLANGEDAVFDTDKDGRPTDVALNRIHTLDRGEIVQAIVKLGSSKLTESDLGN